MGQTEEGMSGIAIFFTVLFSMLGCIFLIVIGLVVYSHWNESRRKRFYWGRRRGNGTVQITVAHESETPQTSACRAQRLCREDDTIMTGDLSPTTKSHSPTLPFVGMKQYDTMTSLFYTLSSASAWHTPTWPYHLQLCTCCTVTFHDFLRAAMF